MSLHARARIKSHLSNLITFAAHKIDARIINVAARKLDARIINVAARMQQNSILSSLRTKIDQMNVELGEMHV